MTPWWAQGLQWGLWWVVMGLLMGWLARARMTPRPGQGRRVLQHPRGILVLGAVTTGLFGAAALGSVLFPDKEPSLLIPAIFLGFAAMGAYLVAEFYRVWFRLEPGGMRYQTLTKKPGSIRWAEVSRLHYSPSMKWFVVEARSGTAIRVSAMLIGLPEFARSVLAEVPRARIDAGALPVLEETAAGSPPSIWG